MHVNVTNKFRFSEHFNVGEHQNGRKKQATELEGMKERKDPKFAMRPGDLKKVALVVEKIPGGCPAEVSCWD